MRSTTVEYTFREGVLKVFNEHPGALTACDIKHLLVTEQNITSTITQRAIAICCSRLTEQGLLERTAGRIENQYAKKSTHKQVGYVKIRETIPKLDVRPILWVVRDHEFSAAGKPIPKKILYDRTTRYLVGSWAGMYVGVERVECELQSIDFYESRGWNVVS